MVTFVNIREFKVNTEEILRRLDRSDVVLTVHGRPKALLRKISESDLSVKEELTEKEWDKLEKLSRGGGKIYKSGHEFLKALKKL